MKPFEFIEDIELKSIEPFIRQTGFIFESNVDYSVAAYRGKEIVGTCSKSGKVIKMLAVAPDCRGENLALMLVEKIKDQMFREGLFHYFAFTAIQNSDLFRAMGFNLICKLEGKIAFFEGGIYTLKEHLEDVIKKYNLDMQMPKHAIVMNCNPFTKGHQHLIETVASECAELLIFVVSEDKSIFPYASRYDMVCEGVSHLNHVKVISGADYLVSESIFPSYFLKTINEKTALSMRLDALIFFENYCRALNIVVRHVGEEPYCELTNLYNQILAETAELYPIKLKLHARLKWRGQAISASSVRKAIGEGDMKSVKEMVPVTTWNYLMNKEGDEIVQKLRARGTTV